MPRIVQCRLLWEGPFVLQGTHGESCFDHPAGKRHGVYILAVKSSRGYLIYSAGWTTRPFATRMREHIREYKKGTYHVLDGPSLQRGERKMIWRGMWTKKATNTPHMKALFQARRSKIQPAIDKLLTTFRVFFAPLQHERRILARIEAAIMDILWSGTEPISTIPDTGMALSPRRDDELPFVVHSIPPVILRGLPRRFKA